MLLNTDALPGSTNISFYINQSCWLLTQQPEVKRNHSQWRLHCVETRPKARRQKWKLDSNVKQDRENELEIKSSDFFFFKMVMSLLSHIIEKFCTKRTNERTNGLKGNETRQKISQTISIARQLPIFPILFRFVLFSFVLFLSLPSFSWSSSSRRHCYWRCQIGIAHSPATRSFVTSNFVLIISIRTNVVNKKRLHAYHSKAFFTMQSIGNFSFCCCC